MPAENPDHQIGLIMETLINQYLLLVGTDDAVADAAVGLLVADITSRTASLLALVQTLGHYLTLDDDAVRPHSVELLSRVLAAAPETWLQQEVLVLTDFYLAKMDDSICGAGTLHGLAVLASSPRFGTKQADRVVEAVRTQYDPAKHLAKVRLRAFEVLAAVLARHPVYVPTVAEQFTQLYLHIALGEKDPRNLVALFRLHHAISTELGLADAKLNEEMFDAVFCYFPISFNPPKNSAIVVTGDQLRLALRESVAAALVYAKDAFPALVEKLTTTNARIKLDVLDTMLVCVEQYETEAVVPFWLTVWNALKYELLHNDLSMFDALKEDNVTTKAASADASAVETAASDALLEDTRIYQRLLDVFRLMVSKLRPEHDAVDAYLSTVLEDLEPNLKPDHKQFKQLCVVLAAVAEADGEAFNTVAGRALAAIFATPITDWTVLQRRAVMAGVGFFLSAYARLFARAAHMEVLRRDTPIDLLRRGAVFVPEIGVGQQFAGSNVLVDRHKDNVLALFLSTLVGSSPRETGLRAAAIGHLVQLVRLPYGFTSLHETLVVLLYLNDVLVGDDTPATRDALVEALVVLLLLSRANVALFLELLLPTYLNMLPRGDEAYDASAVADTLQILVRLSALNEVAEALCIRLASRVATTPNPEYVVAMVDAMGDAIEQLQQHSPYLMNNWVQILVAPLVGAVWYGEALPGLVELVGRVVQLVVTHVDQSRHQAVWDSAAALFVDGEPSVFARRPLDAGAVSLVLVQASPRVGLFVRLLAAVDKSVEVANAWPIVTACTSFALLDDDYVRLGYLQAAALVVNKFVPRGSDNVKALVTSTAELVDPADLSAANIHRIELLAWVLRGLLLRQDALGIPVLHTLLLWLETPCGAVAARLLELLVAPSPAFVRTPATIVSHVGSLDERLLYKQQLLSIVTPQVVAGFQKHALGPYVDALLRVIQHMPPAVVLPHASSFWPVLLVALTESSDAGVLGSALSAVQLTLREMPDLVAAHLPSVVPRLVQLTDQRHSASAVVREQAAATLTLLAQRVPAPKLVPFVRDVLRGLACALDDRRRSVRRAAQDARHAYYEMA